LPLAGARARAYTHTHTHTQGVHKRCKSDWTTSTWYTLDNANAGSAITFKSITRKVFNEKILYYSVLKNSR